MDANGVFLTDTLTEIFSFFDLNCLLKASFVCRRWRALSKSILEKGFDKTKQEADFDENGILYFIGTDFGRKPWCMDTITSYVTVRDWKGQKSTRGDHSEPIEFNNHISHVFNRGDQARRIFIYGSGGYYEFDLGRHIRVNPVAYCLRHGSAQNRAMRSWQFLGSNDRKDWVLISDHRNDQGLPVHEGATHTFRLKEVKESWRYFRILKTGPDAGEANEGGRMHYFHCSGFELYGHMFLVMQQETNDEEEEEEKDDEDISHYI
eukprot:TRINITY_DN5500_c0_g1_i1.p1 TRINITY_DN5500_c0_g1~~TRINITY_DN5500_c0_g1_i1.p1  ORF type:complete len:277 (-),score=64.55 TRINITY_DN5500_c0_g1_i1:53-841(-)